MDDDDYSGRDEWQAEFVEKAIDDQRRNHVANYLGNYGDAVQTRVDRLLRSADDLIRCQQFEFAVVASVTAMELILRHYLVKPLLQGEFWSDFAADQFIDEIFKGRRSANDRDLLPILVERWRIDLKKTTLTDDIGSALLWATFTNVVIPSRNSIVHSGRKASAEDADTALKVPFRFMKVIVTPIADAVGLSWSATRKWCEVRPGIGGGKSRMLYSQETPFRHNKRPDDP